MMASAPSGMTGRPPCDAAAVRRRLTLGLLGLPEPDQVLLQIGQRRAGRVQVVPGPGAVGAAGTRTPDYGPGGADDGVRALRHDRPAAVRCGRRPAAAHPRAAWSA